MTAACQKPLPVRCPVSASGEHDPPLNGLTAGLSVRLLAPPPPDCVGESVNHGGEFSRTKVEIFVFATTPKSSCPPLTQIEPEFTGGLLPAPVLSSSAVYSPSYWT